MNDPSRTQFGRNVLGEPLQPCNTHPMTGFFRDGCCRTGPDDLGLHTICVVMTDEFLAFSKAQGNDLSTPAFEFQFPGLKEGDRWCLCARRWVDALEAGCAPQIILAATHISMLEFANLADLKAHAAD